jgi:MoaA/NifB/PqqE/SkfB family radical SAM enzyme
MATKPLSVSSKALDDYSLKTGLTYVQNPFTIMTHLNLEITRKCNQHCFYCFNDSNSAEKAGVIRFEDWTTILDEMQKNAELQSLHVTGGEPFIWPRTIDLLAYAQGIGLNTSILSNGLQIDSLAKNHAQVLANLKVAQISLDAITPELHDSRRRTKGAWQQAIKAITSLRSLNVHVEISCVVDDNNLEELILVGKFAQSIGAILLVRPLTPIGRAADNNLSSIFQKRFEKALQELATNNIATTHDIFNYVPINIDTDMQNRQQGIFTVEPSGHFRGIQGFTHQNKIVTNALELLQSA